MVKESTITKPLKKNQKNHLLKKKKKFFLMAIMILMKFGTMLKMNILLLLKKEWKKIGK